MIDVESTGCHSHIETAPPVVAFHTWEFKGFSKSLGNVRQDAGEVSRDYIEQLGSHNQIVKFLEIFWRSFRKDRQLPGNH